MQELTELQRFVLASYKKPLRALCWTSNVSCLNFSPRPFQLEILYQAEQTNVLACISSERTKRFLAESLIIILSHNLRIPYEKGGRRSVYLVPSVCEDSVLAEIALSFNRRFDLVMAYFQVDMAVELWTRERWLTEFSKFNVCAFPSNLFSCLLSMKTLSFDMFSLIVFDNCHMLYKDRAYKLIMAEYSASSFKPRIFAVTTSLFDEKCRPTILKKHLTTMKNAFCCKVLVGNELFGKISDSYAFGSNEHHHVTAAPKLSSELYDEVLKIFKSAHDFQLNYLSVLKNNNESENFKVIEAVKLCDQIFEEFYAQSLQLGLFVSYRALLRFIIQLESLIMRSSQDEHCQMRSLIINHTLTNMRAARRICLSRFSTNTECCNQNMSPKFFYFYNLLKEMWTQFRDKKCTSEEEFMCIVLVEKTLTALNISSTLKDLFRRNPSTLNELSANFLVPPPSGPASARVDCKQEDIMKSFRMGELSVLITTFSFLSSVSLPPCNFCICFDPPNTYQSYICAKGLLSFNSTRFDILMDENCSSEIKRKIAMFNEIEKIFVSLCPKETVFDETGAIVDSQVRNSYSKSFWIEVINKYCAKLPSDPWTFLSPRCEVFVRKTPAGTSIYRYGITLPMNSILRSTIISPFSPSYMHSKLKTARAVCKMLKHKGEINEDYSPKTKESFFLEQFLPDDDDCLEYDSFKRNGCTPGSTKRKQVYRKAISDCLSGPTDFRKDLFVYSIEIILHVPLDSATEYRTESNRSLGLVCAKELLQIPEFPVFTKNGEKIISFHFLRTARFTEEEINLLFEAHYSIFSKILYLDRRPLTFTKFSTTNLSPQCIFVVLKKTNEDCWIDWEKTVSLSTFDDCALYEHPEYDENHPYKFTNCFDDSVVLPYYRTLGAPEYFHVVSIDNSLTPLSKFPSSTSMYKCFKDYFEQKYNVKLTNLVQPLLVVERCSTRLSMLTPRYMNMKTLRHRTYKKTYTACKRVFLIPELVSVHIIESSLWNKLICIPSIVYRLNSLLLIENFRREIAREISLKSPQELLTRDFFQRISFNWDVTKESAMNLIEENQSILISPGAVWDFEISHWTGAEMNTLDAENQCWMNASPGNTFVIDCEHLENDDLRSFSDDDTLSTVSRTSYQTGHFAETRKYEIDMTTLEKDFAVKSNKILSSFVTKAHEHKNFLYDDAEDLEVKLPQSHNAPQRGSNDDEIHFEKIRSSSIGNDNAQKKTLNEKKQDVQDIVDFQSDKLESDIIECSEICLNETPPECDINHLNECNNEASLSRHSNGTDAAYIIDDSLDIAYTNDSCSDMNEKECVQRHREGLTVFTNVVFDHHQNVTVMDERYAASSCISFNNVTSERGIIDDYEFPVAINLDLKNDGDAHAAGPDPSLLLKAFTLSSACDGFNLERLEVIGDSFLKYSVAVYLLVTYPKVNEGKLSFMRSKIVSNYNLYKIGKRKRIYDCINAISFDPYDKWVPPFFEIGKTEITESSMIGTSIWQEQQNSDKQPWCVDGTRNDEENIGEKTNGNSNAHQKHYQTFCDSRTEHVISDKSIADVIEALIGAYLVTSGPLVTTKFINWLGIKMTSETGSFPFDNLVLPSPVDYKLKGAEEALNTLLQGFEVFEETIGYRFIDRAYLLQAFTHPSYMSNNLTDCYQRSEFVGDSVLDYVITRHLYETCQDLSPGQLTDLRASLVNNNLFAFLAVKYGYHRYFRCLSQDLCNLIDDFVKSQLELKEDFIMDDEFWVYEDDDETDEMENLEVPKCLADLFESVAGAIYLDSKGSLNTVWKIYFRLMKPFIEKFFESIPKSPVRELLEMFPDSAHFLPPEKMVDGRIRVILNVIGKGTFRGIGRCYKLAKTAAARCALRQLQNSNE